MRSEFTNQRIQRTSQHAGEAVQLGQQTSYARPHASLLEQYDSWMSSVCHPDLSMLRDLVKSNTSQGSTRSEIENQVFSMFKETADFRILKNEMQDAIGELECLFPNNSRHAAYVNQKLNLIMQRATITTDQSPADFGNQKANIVQFTCLRLKQLATLARQLKNAAPRGVNVQGYIDKLKDCVNNIAADAELCGPGVVQKVEDEFANLKLRLFPPSIEHAIRQTQDQIAKQIIIGFCNQTYIATGLVQPGNQLHYVAAWLDRLIDSDPEFAHLSKHNDPFAPLLQNNRRNTDLQKELKEKISTAATPVHACRVLSESVFQDIHDHMGNNVEDIGKNYAAFSEILREIQTRYPGLKEHHLLQTDDLYNFKLRTDTDHATLFFLRQLPENIFNPNTVDGFDGLQIKYFGDLVWTESIDSETGENQVVFEVTVNMLFNRLRVNDFRSIERLVQLLPIIGNVLFKTNPQQRIRFLAELLQRVFGSNPAPSTQFLLAGLASATDASNFVAVLLQHLSNPTINQTLEGMGYSNASLLQWHSDSDGIKNYFTNSEVIIHGLIERFLSNNAVRDVIAFAPTLSNPHLAYSLLVASKEKLAGHQRIPSWLRSSQWSHYVSTMKNECKMFENYSGYLALKASESCGNDRPLKAVRPERLFQIIISGNLTCLKFALNFGANPNAFFVVATEFGPVRNVRVSMLQSCIECGNIEMVRALLEKGAFAGFPVFSNGVELSMHEYAVQLGHSEIADLLTSFHRGF